jgi:hypothetical protein
MVRMKREFYESPVLSEREILLVKRRLNDGKVSISAVMEKSPDEGWKITPEQTQKGLAWLMNQWKSPKGVERKNNPFGYREEEILKNFKEFRLVDFYDNANYYQAQAGIKNYIPLYEVISKDGDGFQYYVVGGKISIVG